MLTNEGLLHPRHCVRTQSRVLHPADSNPLQSQISQPLQFLSQVPVFLIHPQAKIPPALTGSPAAIEQQVEGRTQQDSGSEDAQVHLDFMSQIQLTPATKLPNTFLTVCHSGQRRPHIAAGGNQAGIGETGAQSDSSGWEN